MLQFPLQIWSFLAEISVKRSGLLFLGCKISLKNWFIVAVKNFVQGLKPFGLPTIHQFLGDVDDTSLLINKLIHSIVRGFAIRNTAYLG